LHSEIETIHPFADGNGRIGRLWQTLILAKWNPIFEWIPMESVVYEKRQDYYDALQAAQNANDSGVFIEFILSVLLEAVEAQAKRQADERKVSEDGKKSDGIKDGLSDGIKDGLNGVQQKMLALISKKPTITIEVLSNELGINKRNVENSSGLLCLNQHAL
jgi:Fic family protein